MLSKNIHYFTKLLKTTNIAGDNFESAQFFRHAFDKNKRENLFDFDQNSKCCFKFFL